MISYAVNWQSNAQHLNCIDHYLRKAVYTITETEKMHALHLWITLHRQNTHEITHSFLVGLWQYRSASNAT